jgi:NAD(P)-dependent dehydrogenase (short-subunit alcohol dehydrogenase family)
VNVENHYKAVPGLTEETSMASAREAVPIARYGLPLDVAKLAVLLCCEDTSYMVGQTIVVDGGTTSLMSLVSDFRSESAARFGTGYLPGV